MSPVGGILAQDCLHNNKKFDVSGIQISVGSILCSPRDVRGLRAERTFGCALDLNIECVPRMRRFGIQGHIIDCNWCCRLAAHVESRRLAPCLPCKGKGCEQRNEDSHCARIGR